ncbi:hypothetical protein [Streptomyces sp. Qhu_M48]
MIGYDTVGTGRGAVCVCSGQRTGYETAGAGRGVFLSQSGHVIG